MKCGLLKRPHFFHIRKPSNCSLAGSARRHCVLGAQQFVAAHPLGIVSAVQIAVYRAVYTAQFKITNYELQMIVWAIAHEFNLFSEKTPQFVICNYEF